jgi:hypothetical protein
VAPWHRGVPPVRGWDDEGETVEVAQGEVIARREPVAAWQEQGLRVGGDLRGPQPSRGRVVGDHREVDAPGADGGQGGVPVGGQHP